MCSRKTHCSDLNMSYTVPCLNMQIKILFKITIISPFVIFLTLTQFSLLAPNQTQIILHVLTHMFGLYTPSEGKDFRIIGLL